MSNQPVAKTGKHYAISSAIQAADTSHIARKMIDVAYGGRSDAQKMDIYWPASGNGPFPAIVSIHGGAFMGGDKGDIQVLPMLKGIERGYVVASINYRMSGEALFPALIHDAKAAIRWIRCHADALRFDPLRIAVWGGSAGGYLSAMLGVTTCITELEDLSLGNAAVSSAVQAVVDWFGPTDFLKMDEQLAESGLAPAANEAHSGKNSPESLLLGAKITTIPELVQAANPETYVQRDVPPFFIQHGLRDNTVPYQQSAALAKQIERAAGRDRVKLDLLPDAGHGGPAFNHPDNVKQVFDFLDQHLK